MLLIVLYAYMPQSGFVINALPVCAWLIWHNNSNNTKKCWYISLLLLFYYYFFDVCGGLVCLITIVNVVGFVFSSVVCEVFLYGKYFSLHKWYAPHFFFAFMLMTALNNLLKQNPPALQTSDARLVHGYSGCIGLQDWL